MRQGAVARLITILCLDFLGPLPIIDSILTIALLVQHVNGTS